MKEHASAQPDEGRGCGFMLFLNTYFYKLGKYRKESKTVTIGQYENTDKYYSWDFALPIHFS